MARESVAGASGHGPRRMETVTIENVKTGRRYTWEDESPESLASMYEWLESSPDFVLVEED